jgi:hypothetical protein
LKPPKDLVGQLLDSMRRIAFALLSCSLLFAGSAAIAAWRLTGVRIDHPAGYLVAYAAPALAATALFLLIVGFPDLMPSGRPAFPVNLTFPILHSALAYAVVALVTSEGVAIERPPEALLPAMMWLEWHSLGFACLAQMAVLTLAVAVFRRPKPAVSSRQ